MRKMISLMVAGLLVGASATADASSHTRGLPQTFAPYRSVGGVRLGMDEQAVRARLGPPTGGKAPVQLAYARQNPRQTLLITFDTQAKGTPVASIQADGGRFMTSQGVGIGSTRAAIHRAFPHLKPQYGTLTGMRGSDLMEIGFSHGRADEIVLGDTKLRRG